MNNIVSVFLLFFLIFKENEYFYYRILFGCRERPVSVLATIPHRPTLSVVVNHRLFFQPDITLTVYHRHILLLA